MSQQHQVFFGSVIAILGLASLVVYAQDPGGYNVKTRFENINEAGPIKNANEPVVNNVFKTITERCEASGIPSNYYGVCCQQPVYWQNPACPYQMKGQDLVYDPKNEFSSDEENQAYQSVIDCLVAGGDASSCQSTPAIQGIVSDAKGKTDTCFNNCQSTYQSCANQCTTPAGSGDGPYQDSQANAAYRAVVQCLRAGTSNCLRVAASYVPDSQVSEIAIRAISDWHNGTVWEPPQQPQSEVQACVDACHATGQTCTDNCPGYQDMQNKVTAAGQKALNDWQTSEDTPPVPPVAKPLTAELQDAETHAKEINSNKMTDADGKEVTPQDVLRGGLDDTNPVVTLQFPLKKINAGEKYNAVISAGPPEIFPIQEVIFTPDHDVANGSLTVTVGNKTKPEQFLLVDPPQLDYVRPKVAPDPKQYQLQDYFRLDAKIDSKASPLAHDEVSYSDIFFHMVIAAKDLLNPFSSSPSSNPESMVRLASVTAGPVNSSGSAQSADLTSSVVLLHYSKDTGVWDELPTEKGICSTDICTYTAKSPSASTFALVLKKNTPSATNTNTSITNTSGVNNDSATKDQVKPATFLRKPLAWFGLVLWAGLIFWLHRKLWHKNAQALKSRSLVEKSKIIHEIGFKRMVFVAGMLLYGSGLAIVFSVLAMLHDSLGLSAFFGIYLLSVIGGLVFGLIMWIIFSIVRRFHR